MRRNLIFNERVLECLLGGVSALDIPRLEITEIKEAHEFIKCYGYDLEDPSDQEKAWGIHRRAVAFIRDKILEDDEELPEIIVDPKQLKDIGYLLIYVSTQEHRDNMIQRWSCALLRVMHVIVHLRNDLFSAFYDEIQKQVLKPVQMHISTDAMMGTVLGTGSAQEKIRLHRFDIKSLKTSDSSIIKGLAKPNALALNLFDKLGVRFVTRSLFDCFRVVRFLVDHHIISFPHVIPDQSNNSLYPLKLFFETMDELEGQIMDLESIDALLIQKLETLKSNEQPDKVNIFSSENYRFLKFITRQLIRVKIGANGSTEDLSFFYPYEIQIMDYNTYLKNISGPASHDKYKERQRKVARSRILRDRASEHDGKD